MNKKTLDGLVFYFDSCSRFDNTPIRSSATEMSVSVIKPPESFTGTDFVANHTREGRIWANDASGLATCAYSIKGENLCFRGMLTRTDGGFHRATENWL